MLLFAVSKKQKNNTATHFIPTVISSGLIKVYSSDTSTVQLQAIKRFKRTNTELVLWLP